MEAKLKEAFVEALGIDGLTTDWSSLTYRGIPEWDSVAHMQLVAEIEDTFDIMLETDDVIGMSSFVTAGEILKRYGVASD
jgi:acyl carrier protein